VAAVTGAGKVTETDELTSAVVETARHSAPEPWDQPPRLYALVRRAALASFDEHLPAGIKDAQPGSLIPIEQDPLPEGEPAEVLAGIRWPEEVVGCVLVTGVVIPDPGPDASSDAAAGKHAAAGRPEQRQGRLTVGILREPTDRYKCCLQLQGEEDLIIHEDLADELVTALLGTFLT
jgi:hypothetical protein